jgi:predicted glycoside hydrolase/deacetylase ChbG (UPF0249 family)
MFLTIQKNFKVGLLSLVLIALTVSFANGQNTIQEKLGYAKDAKLLIIHADDFGLCHSENRATIKAMEDGVVNSASIMVPCPWFTEAAQYTKQHPDLDIGIHLTLTNEWSKYKWGTVADACEVPSLIAANGFMHEECPDVSKHAKIEEAEKELRAQIERAIAAGVNPTHLDSHMGCLFYDRADLFEVYIKLGKEYKVPTMINKEFFTYMVPGEDHSDKFMKFLDDPDLIIANKVMMDPGIKTKEDLFNFYSSQLGSSLVSGLNVMIMHVGYNNEELRGITARAKNRHWDLEYFTSEECKTILEKNNVKLVTWREVGSVM